MSIFLDRLPSALRAFLTMPASRPGAVIGCLLAASVLEGVGIATLLPILAMVADGRPGGSGLQAVLLETLETLGLPLSFGALLFVMAGLLIAKSVMMILAQRIIVYRSAAVAADMRRRLVARILRARWRCFVGQPVGRLSSVLLNETNRISQGYLAAADCVVFFIQGVAYTFLSFLVSWKVALFGIGATTVITYLLRGFLSRARRSGKKQTRHVQAMGDIFNETVANMKPIKAMGRERHYLAFIDEHVRRMKRALRRQNLDAQVISHVQEIALVLLLVVGFYLAHVFWAVPIADLLVTGIVLRRTVSSLTKVQKAYVRAAQLEPSFDAVAKLLEDTAREREDLPSNGRKPSLERDIRLERVTFAYDEVPVLRDAELVIPARAVTVLAGPSGTGKTTLLDLLLGLMEPDSGRILIDGIDLRELDLHAWRRMVGYAPQDLTLLHTSLRDNIRLGDPNITEADIEEALEIAEARDFVQRLPAGLDTMVGSRGMRFSGGQRQRIALARALVGRPRLLVLDEVTSALDPEVERRVCANLRALATHTTILSVTHRPAWFDIADRIVELYRGVPHVRDREMRVASSGDAAATL